MKQRIRVVSIIRDKDGAILLMKKSRGRLEDPVLWELPTGKISFGEQPEEAMTRTLSEYLKVSVSAIRLKDTITFLALVGASQLSNLYIVYEVDIEINNEDLKKVKQLS